MLSLAIWSLAMLSLAMLPKKCFQHLRWASVVRTAVTLLVLAMVMLTATELLACPTCKEGIAESDPTSQAQAAGYYYSILFMMAMPFLLLGTLGGAAYLSIRRVQGQQLAVANQTAK